MGLKEIDLRGYGKFIDEVASFKINQFYLPSSWPYILVNKLVSLRCDQYGIESLQINPPAGNIWLKRAEEEKQSPLLVWICPEDYPAGGFTNFFRPLLATNSPKPVPQSFSLTYKPWIIEYRIKEFDIECITRIQLIENTKAVRISFSIKNMSDQKQRIGLCLAAKPYCWTSVTAPWDVPYLYQKTINLKEPEGAFLIRSASPTGQLEEREDYFLLTDLKNSYKKFVLWDEFVGGGSFSSPAELWETGQTSQELTKCNISRRSIMASKASIALNAEQEYEFTAILGSLGTVADMDSAENKISKYSLFLYKKQAQKLLSEKKTFIVQCSKRKINTPDKQLNRYVNEYVPLQLEWVSFLDRGWLSGMRGVRDCTQDFTALVEIQPERSKEILLEVLSLQKPDGSFLRQYNIANPSGPHDERVYVDQGLWVWELLYEYLCFRGDFELLDIKLPFYQDNKKESVFGHILRVFEYYINQQNIGANGLCKIRNGDWHDSVNKAGLKGKGETVMVSCHLIPVVENFLKLLNYLKSYKSYDSKFIDTTITRFKEEVKRLKGSLLSKALNKLGFFNGVYTDAGEWVFSDNDPDGEARLSCPVNAFAIIAGILEFEKAGLLLNRLKMLRLPYGYLLFKPGMGEKPIDEVGRLGSGDMPIGTFGENETIYNHGSNGFLGRAASVWGDGQLLYDTLKCMYPYDQDIHPVQKSKTPPYAIVNHWKTAEGVAGQGGDCFFTGSLSVGLRNVYGGLIGFRPTLEGIVIDPIIPSDWKKLSASCTCRNIYFDIEIINQSGQGGTVKEMFYNDHEIKSFTQEIYRRVGFIEYSTILCNNSVQKKNKLKVIL